jgi:transposase-like protein
MQRPDLDTLACVNPACQRFRHAGQGHLGIRKVYGHDHIRLLRCRTCGEAFSERRGSALFNTKLPETKAEDVINHLGEGWSVRATARLVKVWKETVARLLRVSGRHAARLHEQHVRALRPMALACAEQWSCVKKSNNAAPITTWVKLVTGGIIPPWPLTASWWCP